MENFFAILMAIIIGIAVALLVLVVAFCFGYLVRKIKESIRYRIHVIEDEICRMTPCDFCVLKKHNLCRVRDKRKIRSLKRAKKIFKESIQSYKHEVGIMMKSHSNLCEYYSNEEKFCHKMAENMVRWNCIHQQIK